MKLEQRYLILKLKDIEELDEQLRYILYVIVDKVQAVRSDRGKGGLDGIFIAKEWPEYADVFKALSDRVDAENAKKAQDAEYIAKAYDVGREAHRQGISILANPFAGDVPANEKWARGWMAHLQDINGYTPCVDCAKRKHCHDVWMTGKCDEYVKDDTHGS